jgi:hypothetical protein
MSAKPAKKLSRRQALRAFDHDAHAVRRMTPNKVELHKTAAEAAAELRRAESLHRAVEELAAIRAGNGGWVH